MKGTGRLQLMALAGCLLVVLSACEDPIPEDNYVPLYVTESFIYVDRPIEGLKVMVSQPVLDTFRYSNSIVRDADVTIFEGATPLRLEYRNDDDNVGDYYYPDDSYLVKPQTEYRLEIRFPDGSVMNGRTTTPNRIEWRTAPREVLQYPLDTINLDSPDSLDIKWTAEETVPAYLIAVRCNDTLEYGRYLDPATDELNRRIYRFWEEDAPRFDEITRWGFATTNSSPVVWFAFKWFGRHTVTIYAPEDNMFDWFRLTHRGSSPEYNFLLSNIEGDGTGVFGSASLVESEVFMIKNQR